MSAWTDLRDRVVNDVEGLFTESEKEVVSFFSAAIDAFEKAVPVTAIAIIKASVSAAQGDPLPGETKRSNVENAIKSTLDSAGITLEQSLINTGIEIAVQALGAAVL